MKLVRVDVKGANAEDDRGLDVVVHPQLTVVLGASGAVRDTLIDVVAGIPRGAAPVGGVIDVDGVRQDLSPESLAELGLRTDLDVVVRADDLPGREDIAGERTELSAATAARDEARRAVAHAETLATQARTGRDEVQARVDELRAGGGEAATVVAAAAAARAEAATAFEAAAAERARHDAAVQRLRTERTAATVARAAAVRAVAEAALPEPAPLDNRIPELHARREELQRRIAALVPDDPSPVVAGVEAIERAPADPAPIPAALAFADAWRDVHEQLGELERTETEEERQARARLDEARQAAVEAEEDLRLSAPPPELVADLEAAHASVLDAQDKTNSRLSGTRARQRLAQAREVERELLEQLGHTTYADYMMSSSSRGVSAGKRATLQNARIRVAEADTEWQTAGGDPAREIWRADLFEQRAAMAPRIALLLGHEPDGPDVEQELRALRAAPPADDALLDDLRSALAGVGLEVGDEFRQAELLELAQVWLDENAQLDERRAGLEAEVAAIDGQLAEIEGAPAVDEPDLDAAKAVLKGAEGALADVEGRLTDLGIAVAEAEQGRELFIEQETAARERLAALDAPAARSDQPVASLLAEAEEQLERAAQEVTTAELELARVTAELTAAEERLATLSAAEADTDADDARSADERDELVEDIEWYLLSRLAAQRSVGDAGSVPLLLDNTFRDLEVAEAVRLMEAIERMSAAVQVIAVSDDRALSFWAEALGAERALVVTLSG